MGQLAETTSLWAKYVGKHSGLKRSVPSNITNIKSCETGGPPVLVLDHLRKTLWWKDTFLYILPVKNMLQNI